MLRLFVPGMTVNGETGLSVLDQAEKVPPCTEVAAASIRIDSLFPTPTLSPLLPFSVFGKPDLTAPVQVVEAEYSVSTNCAVVPVGATSNLTFPSVKLVVAVPEVAP